MRSCAVSSSAAEHAPDPVLAQLGDPRRFPPLVVAAGVVGDDLRHQRLEAGVPAELRRVDLAVRHHHPAEISRPAQPADGDRFLGHVNLAFTETVVSVKI
jgi:hypothetical protein